MKYDRIGNISIVENEKLVRVSVRDLVEFILREGSIDNRTSGSLEKDAMLMGGKLHRKIQRKMGPEYHAEVGMKIKIPCRGYSIQVEGRADGVIWKEDGEYREVQIDEIKCVLRDLQHIEKPVGMHLAQAKCYAFIYAEQNFLEEISVRMTYCNIESEEIKRFHIKYTKAELKDWFFCLIDQYKKWAEFELNWTDCRNSSLCEAEFPYRYRKGQFDIAAAVYRTIQRKKKLFIQAPTGVGKTISVVFPSLKALGYGLGEKIFYLTAKTITRTAAEQAFNLMRSKGASVKTITLTAKEKICFCDEAVCSPDVCPYADGHYDRVNDAVYDLIISQSAVDRECIEKQARKYQVCPFELSLDVSVWMDGIICDYNYVFDPTAHLKRFFSEGNGNKYIFLIDEAHNLVDRGREMYSASLYKEDILEAKKMMKNADPVLARKFGEVNRLLLVLKRECEEYRILDSVSHIILKLIHLLSEMERFLEETEDADKREFILNLYFQVRSFVNIHDRLDENYVIYSELAEDGKFMLKLFCVNPAENLQSFLEYGTGTVFFSATLLPVHYYRKLLSTEQDDYAIYAKSVFPKENRMLLLGKDVSTKYTMRSPEMYKRIAHYIIAVAEAKTGNYMAFFPSYSFMKEVYDIAGENISGIKTAIQKAGMNEQERENFLCLFEEKRQESFVGFCVMGGIFSEGIDLVRDRLIGAVIVGTGIPQVCNEREILKRYFDEQKGQGFDYAYLYPGMNKVLQAAGRVIRTENDRGIILLLDERFMQRRYRETFPREWESFRICSTETLPGYIEEFWK